MMPELVSLCRQRVTLEARSSVDSYGEPTYGSAISYRVKIVGRRRRILADNGEEVLSTHTVYFAVNPAISAHDRITLSTGDVDSTETGAITPAILSVGTFPDDLGRMNTAVFLA